MLTSLIMLSACKKDSESTKLGSDYFPLSVGNNWQLEHCTLREVKGKATLEGKEYYSMIIGNDTTYYRESDNIVWVKNPATGESPYFKLSANVHDTWKFPSNAIETAWNISLESKTDTITINGHMITNCYRFYFDIPLMVDEEHYVCLAPGLGYIEENCGFCAYPKLQLQHARIDGNNISF
jgi:hypothetical protein